MAFPSTLDNFVEVVDNVDDVMAVDINELQAAIEAIEAKLGVDGSAVTGSVDYKLTQRELLSNKATNFGTINDTLYPTVKAVNDQIVSAVAGLLDYRGPYDASGNTFPASGGSGTAGAVLKGDFWIVSVAGTLGSVAVTAGDLVIALQDTPGQTAGNWTIVEHDLGYAPENSANKVTSISGASTDTQYPSAKLLYDQLALKIDKSLFDANTILYATSDNTPVALTIAASRIVGRKATGDISALTAAETLAIITPTTTEGDLIYAGASNVLTRLAATTNGFVLTLVAGVPAWAAPAGGAVFNGAKVYNNTQAALSLSSGTPAAFPFTHEVFDTNAYHDNSTNNTRLTVPTTGYYLFTGELQFANPVGTSVSTFKAYLKLNNTTDYGFFYYERYPVDSSANRDYTIPLGAIVLYLTAGDYVELYLAQQSGSTMAVRGTAVTFAPPGTHLSVQFLGT